MKKFNRKATLDDGCNPELVQGCVWSGELEIPTIRKPERIIIPSKILPYSEINESADFSEGICEFEGDEKFARFFIDPDAVIEELKPFPVVFSPDASMYRDMPLGYQVINLIRNRACGYHMQQEGLYVIPTIRWGDERTYTTKYFPEKIAFLGAEKNSIVAIGSYGVVKLRQNRYHFEAGLAAMMEELTPTHIIVYGSSDEKIFGDYLKYADFHFYPDHTSRKHREEGGQNGKRS